MIKSICVIGHPSSLGGADTELDHQIRLWRIMGVDVYICHTSDIYPQDIKERMINLGCKYIPPKSWKDLDGLDVISFCNGTFLDNLPAIKKYARSTTFVNCMTWNFPKEIQAQENNLIDFHLYQTDHQIDKVSEKLKNLGSQYNPIKFIPYFDRSDFPFKERANKDFFRFGRISRDDIHKYKKSQLWIYETMTAPVLKQGVILGWSDKIEKKIGKLPYYIKGLKCNEISQINFYEQCDVIIMTTDTFENLPRVGFEAMASGSLLIVDKMGGWEVLIKDGETGWLCNDHREFVYKASRCAFETQESDNIRHNALDSLIQNWGINKSTKSWEKVFNLISK